MVTIKEDKVCIECKKDLGRYWGKSFCKKCLGELLNEHRRETDAKEARERANRSD